MFLPLSYEDPLDLFRAAVDGLNRGNWRRVAELCDPRSLDAFKAELVAEFGAAPGKLKLTTAELLKAIPNMPRAVAEYQVQRFREQMDPRRRLRDEIPGVETASALTSMKPLDVFASWLDGRSLRHEVERAVERKHLTRAMANEIIAEGRPYDYRPLGFVHDGDAMCHIVYRAARGDQHPETIPALRQADNTWMLVADRQFSLVGLTPLIGVDMDAAERET